MMRKRFAGFLRRLAYLLDPERPTKTLTIGIEAVGLDEFKAKIGEVRAQLLELPVLAAAATASLDTVHLPKRKRSAA